MSVVDAGTAPPPLHHQHHHQLPTKLRIKVSILDPPSLLQQPKTPLLPQPAAPSSNEVDATAAHLKKEWSLLSVELASSPKLRLLKVNVFRNKILILTDAISIVKYPCGPVV
ncbi:MAG TPA: hypothetical protein VLL96_02815 [Candidatus Deferrimicrobiaceae bacterium]|nr:hypothetical protein [Candidatus Deferrimicrobiaceae bacterium]